MAESPTLERPAMATLHFPFDERKAAQVTARLVEQKGRRLPYLHAMKMLYLIDRLALAKWGQPVIGGNYWSMKKGPVISEILNLIKGERVSQAWSDHLHTSGYDLVLEKSAGVDELSKAELDLVDTVFAEHGHRNRWDIVAEMHDQFREWENPGNSRRKIAVESILAATGKSADEIREIADRTAYYQRIDAALK